MFTEQERVDWGTETHHVECPFALNGGRCTNWWLDITSWIGVRLSGCGTNAEGGRAKEIKKRGRESMYA